MAYYTFTSSDISAIAAAGVTALFNGVTLKSGDSYGVGSSDKLKFTCNSGKKFTITGGVVSVNFLGSNGTRVNGTLSNSDTVADFSGSLPSGSQPWNPPSYSFNIATNTVVAPAKYTFTAADITALSTAHVTLTKNGTNVVTGTTVVAGDVLIGTCASGYKFVESGSNIRLFFSGNVNEWFIANSDKTVGTLTVPDDGEIYTIFRANTEALPNAPLKWGNHPTTGVVGTAVDFTWSGGNISVSPNKYNVVVTDGTTVVDDITTATPSYTLAAQTSARTLLVTVYDKGGKNDSTASNIASSIVISAAPKPTRFTFTADHVAKLTNSHVNMTINGSPVVVGSTIVEGDSLVATAISGYEFYKDPLASIYLQAIANRYPFTLSSDNKTATYTVAAINYTVFDVDTKLPTPETKAGNNVYIVDNDKLSKITENRFVLTGTDVLLDYGQYILSVLELPFTIDPALIAGTENVMLGDKDTHVAANKVSVDILPVNMGDITIPETYNNLLDYDNTTAILHLPFAPSINIDPEYVIGQTLSVEYLIDCYTGKATINIKSTKIGGAVIDQKIVSLGINIPYAQFTGGDVTNSNIEVGGDNRIKIPFIEIVRSDAPLKDGLFSAVIVDEKILNTQTGFITVDNIDLVSKAIKSEKDELISILNGGVIIK